MYKYATTDSEADAMLLLAQGAEPITLEEVLSGDDQQLWKEAIQSELESLGANNTWTLCKLPAGCSTLKCRWVFRIKSKTENEPKKCKARLVAKGFSQRYGIGYNELMHP